MGHWAGAGLSIGIPSFPSEIKCDSEKVRYSRDALPLELDDESHSLSDSSYDTSPTYPILGRPILKRKPRVQLYRFRNSLTRWLCLALLSSLLLFILCLFRLSILSSTLGPTKTDLSRTKLPSKPPQWESFPFLRRYYGGRKTLVLRKDNVPEYPGGSADDPIVDLTSEANETQSQGYLTAPSSTFNPYPDYASTKYMEEFGTKNDCFLDAEGTVKVPQAHYFLGIPMGFPDAVIGSNELLGINDDICFDRFGRLGPYGLGYGHSRGGTGAGLDGDRVGADDVWKTEPPVDFRTVKWAEAQEWCAAANIHRFPALPSPRIDRYRAFQVGASHRGTEGFPDSRPKDSESTNVTLGLNRLPRTAFIIRTWSDFEYGAESLMYLRSLVSELSLLSGGEYIVHFLIHVKDDNLPIWSDDETYDRILQDSLPDEFHGMGTLWSERQMGLIYGGLAESFTRGLPVHGVYRSAFMPLQYFAFQHPEYDYYWNWEMDIRYTGHWYHFFDRVTHWAKDQPRKGLWERNARFYVPSVHGSWEDFRQMVRVQTEIGTSTPNNLWSPLKHGRPGERRGEKPIWGPERPDDGDILETKGEGIPMVTYEKDKYVWGVGEDADLIVFNPLFEPDGTTWLLKDDVTGYNKQKPLPPRRTAITTASRLSRKLLTTMHRETSIMRHTMFSEMWPATVALHHGFKAVYVPHSVYIDRRWPTNYLETVFNGGRNGAAGGARTSVFGDREHNFKGTTWFYSAGHSLNLWRRWLGFRVDNEGGEEHELARDGRMCLPSILLHPVKDVDMITESSEDLSS